LKETVEACKVGCSVRDLCIKADQRLEEETGKAFKKDKKLQKGKILCKVALMSFLIILFPDVENDDVLSKKIYFKR
jgi:hypothetical protein